MSYVPYDLLNFYNIEVSIEYCSIITFRNILYLNDLMNYNNINTVNYKVRYLGIIITYIADSFTSNVWIFESFEIIV